MKVERKFILRPEAADQLTSLSSVRIEQRYLAYRPLEVRIRKKDYGNGKEKYLLEVKSLGELSRSEEPVSIDKDEYERLAGLVPGQIVKDRYEISNERHTLEIDVMRFGLEGIVIAEVEFASVADAEEFEISEFEMLEKYVIKEVTEDRFFKNANLAENRITARQVMDMVYQQLSSSSGMLRK